MFRTARNVSRETFRAFFYLLLQRVAHKLRAELGERDARRTRSVGQKRRLGHAGNGVRFKNPARPIIFQDEIGTRHPAARENAMRPHGKVLDIRRRFSGKRSVKIVHLYHQLRETLALFSNHMLYFHI